MSHIFVSTARPDREVAARVATTLGRETVEVWIDDERAVGDSAWDEVLERIRACEVFVVVLSQDWLGSAKCRAEWRYATALDKPILGIRGGTQLGSALAALGDARTIDFSDSADDATELTVAVQSMRAEIGAVPQLLPDRPPTPVEMLLRQDLSAPAELPTDRQAHVLAELRTAAAGSTDAKVTRREVGRLLVMLRDHQDVTYAVQSEAIELLRRLDRRKRPAWVRAVSKGLRRRRGWLLAAAAVAVVAAVAVTVVVVNPFGGPSERHWTEDDLIHLLLTPADMDAVIGVEDMYVTYHSNKLDTAAESMPLDPECRAVVGTAIRSFYGGFDYTGLVDQLLASGRPGAGGLSVGQALVAFTSESAAAQVFEDATRAWGACAGRKVLQRLDSADRYEIGEVRRGDATIAQTIVVQGDDRTCTHVLSVADNVVVEANGCSATATEVSDVAARVVADLVARVLHSADYIPPVPGQGKRLMPILLTPRELTGLQGIDEQTLEWFGQVPAAVTPWASDPGCAGPLNNRSWPTYAGSRFVGIAAQDTAAIDADGTKRRKVFQTAAQFASDSAARIFFDRTAEMWKRCEGSELEVMYQDDDPRRWSFGAVTQTESRIAQVNHEGDTWACEHVMSLAGDRVFEVLACDADPLGKAVKIADQLVTNGAE